MPPRLRQVFVVALAVALFPVSAGAVPVLVRDVRAGAEGGLERRDRMSIGAAGSLVYFAADDGSSGYEPWRSDGTPSGTVRVADVFGGPDDSAPYGFTPLGDLVLFGATSADGGTELWGTDGTTPGTRMVREVAPAALSSIPMELTPFRGEVFYTATEPEGGRELWRTDGTAAGTRRAFDLESGPAGSAPADLVVLNDILYFSAAVGGQRELWRSDGTMGGTFVVRELNGGGSSFPEALTVAGGVLYFVATDGDGAELWRSDGSESGTMQVKDVFPGPDGSNPESLTAVGDAIFFAADDGTSGVELWRSEGDEGSTARVRDIGGVAGSFPKFLTAAGGRLFFTATDLTTGRELWTSDGTPGGTVRLTDLVPGPNNGVGDEFTELAEANGALYFRATDPARGPALWRSDGTAAGTVLVVDLTPGNDGSGGDDDGPTFLTDVAGTLFFRAQDQESGLELWALTECGDGAVSTAEECDDGNLVGGDCCSPTCRFEPAGLRCDEENDLCTDMVCDGAGACDALPNADPCDDGSVCTVADVCGEGVCRGVVEGFPGVRCLLFELAGGELCDGPLPKKLGRVVRRRARKGLRLLDRTERKLSRGVPAEKIGRLLKRIGTSTGVIAVKAADAARARKEKQKIPVECAERLMAGVMTVQDALPALAP